ncbi:MAG: NADH-quinone oxidoreductase subunit NuoE [Gammaproteobacteria bacterium]|nr:NADH-quinone oxidoreductase subunit NuoE [Gammaproteobacteria bacterium]
MDSGKVLTAETLAEIDRWVAKYPEGQQQSAVMAALHLAQEQHGWLTSELIEAVADYLDMPGIAVYEVATFYTMYDLEPVGRHKISVCTNISCMLCGSDQIVDHLKQKLNIGFNQTTADGRFTLKEVECLAACGGAPAMMVGKSYHENLTPELIDNLLDGLD